MLKLHRPPVSQFWKSQSADGQGTLESNHSSVSKYWSPEMKNALGLDSSVGGFSQQLTPSGLKGSSLPIPTLPFHDSAPSLKELFNKPINIFDTPDQHFTAKFRTIFCQTQLTHRSGQESKRWLAGLNMGYWLQQLNFAVWCAMTGCGISRKIFDKRHSTLNLPPRVVAFYQFHIYFTVWRILFQLGGIQNVSVLPDDPMFSLTDNKYNAASLGSTRRPIFGSPTARITVWGVFRFTSQTPDPQKCNTITPGSASSATKVELPKKGTSFISSSQTTTPACRQTGFARRVQTG